MRVQVLLGRWRGAKVAVKVLKASVQADSAISANFEEEAKMLCRLRHPNILDFYGACLTSDTVRLLNGRSMHGWVVWPSPSLYTTPPRTDSLCASLDQMMVISQVWTCIISKLTSWMSQGRSFSACTLTFKSLHQMGLQLSSSSQPQEACPAHVGHTSSSVI